MTTARDPVRRHLFEVPQMVRSGRDLLSWPDTNTSAAALGRGQTVFCWRCIQSGKDKLGTEAKALGRPVSPDYRRLKSHAATFSRESLRLYPPVPMNGTRNHQAEVVSQACDVTRRTGRACRVGTAPARTDLGQADDFDPNRWQPRKAKTGQPQRPNMPFQPGPRSCTARALR